MTTAVALHLSGRQVTFPRVVSSEWVKLRTLRSTVWSYAVLVAFAIGIAALMGASIRVPNSIPASAQVSLLGQASTFWIFAGQLVVAVLGVLVISGEYGTGMIRSTLTAVPRRLPALWAKTLVLFVVTFVVSLVASLAAYGTASTFLATQKVSAPLTDSHLILPILDGALYLSLVAVFSLGIGTIVRSSAGGLAVALGVILVLPILFSIPPVHWMREVSPYLLSNAGLGSFGLNLSDASSSLQSWQQILIVFAWAAVSLALGAIMLTKRDA
jgi:ABC-2 type transport system permease protein